jgi:hypothetical protein
VLAAVVFIPIFIRDIFKVQTNKTVRLLSTSALLSLLLSFLGTIGLTYIIVTKSGGSLLYRDSIYTFLHFQYNGFFTLSIFALFANYVLKKGIELNKNVRPFSIFLCLSIVPALFLSLLWHNNSFFYLLAAIGCFFILMCLFYFYFFIKATPVNRIFSTRIAKNFWTFSIVSFALKMVLQIGTVFPQVGNAVYGDRPVIIGFLHLVFLGLLTFFLFAILIENGYFSRENKVVLFPFFVFSAGIFLNEFLLMLQGLGILFNTNNDIYKWLLWVTAIILFIGAVFIALARWSIIRTKK